MSEESKRQLDSQQVGLGCGTLLLITLIVWFFTAGAADDVERKVDRLTYQLARMEKTLNDMQERLEALSKK